MASEMDDVFLVLMVFMACGKNDTVVQKAATRPSTVTKFILIFLQNKSAILNDHYCKEKVLHVDVGGRYENILTVWVFYIFVRTSVYLSF